MKARFAGMQIAYRRRLPVLPIFTTWAVAKLQSNEERIFVWNGFAPSTIGMIGLDFRGGDNRLSQYARQITDVFVACRRSASFSPYGIADLPSLGGLRWLDEVLRQRVLELVLQGKRDGHRDFCCLPA